MSGGTGQHLGSNRSTTRKEDVVKAKVHESGCGGSIPIHDPHHIAGESLSDEPRDQGCRGRSMLGGFQDHGVSRSKCTNEWLKREHEGVVPRPDHEHTAQGLTDELGPPWPLRDRHGDAARSHPSLQAPPRDF